MADEKPRGGDRRRYPRFPLGLPVEVRLEGGSGPLVVELTDVSASGAHLRGQEAIDSLHVDQRATVGFIVADKADCYAVGQVLRVGREGQFALLLSEVNDAFSSFIFLLAAAI